MDGLMTLEDYVNEFRAPIWVIISACKHGVIRDGKVYKNIVLEWTGNEWVLADKMWVTEVFFLNKLGGDWDLVERKQIH